MIRAILVPLVIGSVELLILLAILVPGVAIAIWRRARAVRDDAVPAPR